MSGSFSGRKEIEGGSEPPLYDEPSAVVNLPQQTSDNKLSTESEPSRLRSEKTQKEGYEPIGELSSSLIEKAKSSKLRIFLKFKNVFVFFCREETNENCSREKQDEIKKRFLPKTLPILFLIFRKEKEVARCLP